MLLTYKQTQSRRWKHNLAPRWRR